MVISSLASCFYRFSTATSRYKPTRSIVPQVGTPNYSSLPKDSDNFQQGKRLYLFYVLINFSDHCIEIINYDSSEEVI